MSSDDEVDIYADLPNLDFGESLAKLEEERRKLKEDLEQALCKLEETSKKNKQLEGENKALGINISSLYKTAAKEIERKDRQIADLRREKDSIVFRRNKKEVKTHSENRTFNGNYGEVEYLNENEAHEARDTEFPQNSRFIRNAVEGHLFESTAHDARHRQFTAQPANLTQQIPPEQSEHPVQSDDSWGPQQPRVDPDDGSSWGASDRDVGLRKQWTNPDNATNITSSNQAEPLEKCSQWNEHKSSSFVGKVTEGRAAHYSKCSELQAENPNKCRGREGRAANPSKCRDRGRSHSHGVRQGSDRSTEHQADSRGVEGGSGHRTSVAERLLALSLGSPVEQGYEQSLSPVWQGRGRSPSPPRHRCERPPTPMLLPVTLEHERSQSPLRQRRRRSQSQGTKQHLPPNMDHKRSRSPVRQESERSQLPAKHRRDRSPSPETQRRERSLGRKRSRSSARQKHCTDSTVRRSHSSKRVSPRPQDSRSSTSSSGSSKLQKRTGTKEKSRSQPEGTDQQRRRPSVGAQSTESRAEHCDSENTDTVVTPLQDTSPVDVAVMETALPVLTTNPGDVPATGTATPFLTPNPGDVPVTGRATPDLMTNPVDVAVVETALPVLTTNPGDVPMTGTAMPFLTTNPVDVAATGTAVMVLTTNPVDVAAMETAMPVLTTNPVDMPLTVTAAPVLTTNPVDVPVMETVPAGFTANAVDVLVIDKATHVLVTKPDDGGMKKAVMPVPTTKPLDSTAKEAVIPVLSTDLDDFTANEAISPVTETEAPVLTSNPVDLTVKTRVTPEIMTDQMDSTANAAVIPELTTSPMGLTAKGTVSPVFTTSLADASAKETVTFMTDQVDLTANKTTSLVKSTAIETSTQVFATNVADVAVSGAVTPMLMTNAVDPPATETVTPTTGTLATPSPSPSDPVVVRHGNMSLSFFSEQCDFTCARRRRVVVRSPVYVLPSGTPPGVKATVSRAGEVCRVKRTQPDGKTAGPEEKRARSEATGMASRLRSRSRGVGNKENKAEDSVGDIATGTEGTETIGTSQNCSRRRAGAARTVGSSANIGHKSSNRQERTRSSRKGREEKATSPEESVSGVDGPSTEDGTSQGVSSRQQGTVTRPEATVTVENCLEESGRKPQTTRSVEDSRESIGTNLEATGGVNSEDICRRPKGTATVASSNKNGSIPHAETTTVSNIGHKDSRTCRDRSLVTHRSSLSVAGTPASQQTPTNPHRRYPAPPESCVSVDSTPERQRVTTDQTPGSQHTCTSIVSSPVTQPECSTTNRTPNASHNTPEPGLSPTLQFCGRSQTRRPTPSDQQGLDGSLTIKRRRRPCNLGDSETHVLASIRSETPVSSMPVAPTLDNKPRFKKVSLPSQEKDVCVNYISPLSDCY